MAQTRSEPEQRVNATTARQGRLGRDVFWVLLISTVLALVALMASWAWNANRLGSTEVHNAREAADARAFDSSDAKPAS
ncbi:MAG: hypothetical protein ACK4YQ_01765 [Phenylobacterium sp.]|uniref:hypothetical protein n=1 Tax=Phenylobacterium sp. TaxID=1871053 RepID=UPI00391C1365